MANSSNYDTMQVCLNGHLITDRYHTSFLKMEWFCTLCGAETITTCPNCKVEIRGACIKSYEISLDLTVVPNFCEHCGEKFPWKATKEKDDLVKSLPMIEAQSPSKIDAAKKEKWIRDVSLAQIQTVLDELLKEPSIQNDEKNQAAVVNLSSRWHIIEESKHRDTVDFAKLFIQTNKINEALVALIRKL